MKIIGIEKNCNKPRPYLSYKAVPQLYFGPQLKVVASSLHITIRSKCPIEPDRSPSNHEFDLPLWSFYHNPHLKSTDMPLIDAKIYFYCHFEEDFHLV